MRRPIACSALIIAGLLGITACGREQKVTSTAQPAATGPEQPGLWSIEAQQDGKPANRVDICADSAVRKGFVRPTPEVNGLPCLPTKAPVETATSYSARCRSDGNLYAVNSGTTGDLTRDFTVEMNVTRQGADQPTYKQVRRYRLVGACPAGWHIGDSAAPGAAELLDTISGKRRPMPPAAG